MEFIRIPAQVDVTRYKGNQDQLEAKYGLPLEVKFCKRGTGILKVYKKG